MSTSERLRPVVGIIGGGQLARMLAAAARRMEIDTVILDSRSDGPAKSVATQWLVGNPTSPEDARRLAALVRHVTTEIDAVAPKGWAMLEAAGAIVRPGLATIEVVRDKLAQRRRLAAAGLPVPSFIEWNPDDTAAAEKFGFPAVQKLRFGGYDGYGVHMLHGPRDLAGRLAGPSLLERRITVRRELSVLLARDPWGRIEVWPIAEVDVVDGRLDVVRTPARLPRRLSADLRILSRRAVEAIDAVGVVAVEWMIDERGRPWLNEVAVRPHNSGHWTIEGATVCQFEQHVRAVLGWPLGRPEGLGAAATANLIGPPNLVGTWTPAGLRSALRVPGVRFHDYGKRETRPGRKLGHLTAVHRDPEIARRRVLEARARIAVTTTREAA
jgi:5-(carboxyamino)imidazole ribonucleotide synthase